MDHTTSLKLEQKPEVLPGDARLGLKYGSCHKILEVWQPYAKLSLKLLSLFVFMYKYVILCWCLSSRVAWWNFNTRNGCWQASIALCSSVYGRIGKSYRSRLWRTENKHICMSASKVFWVGLYWFCWQVCYWLLEFYLLIIVFHLLSSTKYIHTPI